MTTVAALLKTPRQDITALAQLVAIHLAAGVILTKELARLTGYSERAILKAKAELGCGSRVRKPGADVHPGAEPECDSEPERGTPVRIPHRGASRARGLDNKKTNYLEPTVENRPLGSPDVLHRQAYVRGIELKGGKVAKGIRSVQRTKGELDGSSGITFADGKLTVVNGSAAALLADFPGLDLRAVCNRAAPDVARMSYPSHDDAMTCLRKWAQIQSEQPGKAPRRNGPSRFGCGGSP